MEEEQATNNWRNSAGKTIINTQVRIQAKESKLGKKVR